MYKKEQFSNSCTSFCANLSTTTDTGIVGACDAGSQAYCNTIENINGALCTPYIARLVQTQVNPSTTGLIKVQPLANVSNYYNAIVNTADTYCPTSEIVNGTTKPYCKFTTTDGYKTIFDSKSSTDKESRYKSIVDYCSSNSAVTSVINFYQESNYNSNTGIFSVTGFKEWRDNQINTIVNTYKSVSTIDAIVPFYTTADINKLYSLYSSKFSEVDAKLNSLLDDNALKNVNLIKIMNGSSIASDNVYSFIAKQLNTRSDLNTLLDVLSAFLSNCAITGSGLINKGDKYTSLLNLVNGSLSYIKNSGSCNSTPFDTNCSATYGNTQLFNNINFSDNAKKYIDTKRNAYCLNGANINATTFQPCFNQISKVSADVDKDNVRDGLTRFCINNSADANCAPYPKIVSTTDGTQNLTWLKKNTANKVENGVVTTLCGQANQFTIPECRTICEKYPEVCVDDAKAKCALPAYRFNNTDQGGTNTFSNKETYCNDNEEITYDNNSDSSCMYYIILFIVFLLFINLIQTTINSCSYNNMDRIPIATPVMTTEIKEQL